MSLVGSGYSTRGRLCVAGLSAFTGHSMYCTASYRRALTAHRSAPTALRPPLLALFHLPPLRLLPPFRSLPPAPSRAFPPTALPPFAPSPSFRPCAPPPPPPPRGGAYLLLPSFCARTRSFALFFPLFPFFFYRSLFLPFPRGSFTPFRSALLPFLSALALFYSLFPREGPRRRRDCARARAGARARGGGGFLR